MESWPASGLPQSVREDYEMQPRAGLLGTDERRSQTRNRTYPEWSTIFTMYVSATELFAFRIFYDVIIKQSNAFTVPWLDALGFESCFVQFTNEGPSWTRNNVDDLWLLKLPLDIIRYDKTDSSGTNWYPPEESS